MTLRFRFILFFIGTSLATVAITLIVGGGIIYRELMAGVDFLLDAEALELANFMSSFPTNVDESLVNDAIGTHAEIDAMLFYFSVHTPSGRVLYQSPNLHGLGKEFPDLGLPPQKTTLTIEDMGTIRLAEYSIGNLHVQIATALNQIEQIREQGNRTLVFTTPIVLASIVLMALGASRLVLRPIQAIRDTATRINAFNLNERIPTTSRKDELSSLVTLLNEMFDRLEKSFSQIKQFAADTSHELRTPLSLLQLHAEKLRNAVNLPEGLRLDSEELVAEVKQMTEVVNRLMLLSRVDAGIFTPKYVDTNTCEFIEEIFDDAKALAAPRGVTVRLTENEPATVQTDPSCVKQIFFNLLSNTFAHGPKNAIITIKSQISKGTWTLAVQDNGQGVPDSHLDKIFDRFARIPATGEDRIGSGLGLAICKGLTEILRGKISAKNLPEREGFVVSLHLPVSRSL